MRLPVASSRQDIPETGTYLISFDEASWIIAAHATSLGVERIPLDAADGRILAKPAIAQRTSPSTLVSAMDGYAVRESDLTEMPVSLRIAGKSFAGVGCGEFLPPRSCVRVSQARQRRQALIVS